MSYLSNTRIQLKRDTEKNWTSKNPVLYDGEMIIIKTSDGKIKRKIGDGVKKFSELPYDEITIDSATSETSTNPVQNKVITGLLNEKFNKSGGQVDGNINVMGTVNPKSITFELASYQTTEIIPNNDPAVNEIQFANSFSGTAGPAYCRLAIASPDSNRGSQAVNVDYLNSKLDNKMDKSGGTFTGNVSGKYFCGTWLQST